MKQVRYSLVGLAMLLLAACSSGPIEVDYDGADTEELAQAKVGDELLLDHVALVYEDGSDTIDICFSVEERGLDNEDFLTSCIWVDLQVPYEEGFDFEAEGFTRKDPQTENYTNSSGWDRSAVVTVEVTNTDVTPPGGKILTLEDVTYD